MCGTICVMTAKLDWFIGCTDYITYSICRVLFSLNGSFFKFVLVTFGLLSKGRVKLIILKKRFLLHFDSHVFKFLKHKQHESDWSIKECWKTLRGKSDYGYLVILFVCQIEWRMSYSCVGRRRHWSKLASREMKGHCLSLVRRTHTCACTHAHTTTCIYTEKNPYWMNLKFWN